MSLERLISGGQTGVDRGALDAAISAGLPHGGACPRGRLAEDGRIPARYDLQELAESDYAARTRRNVQSGDGTLLLARGRLTGGTALTARLAEELGRPCLVVDLDADPDPLAVRRWIAGRSIRVLNVAGPRESGAPGIHEQARAFMARVIGGDASRT